MMEPIAALFSLFLAILLAAGYAIIRSRIGHAYFQRGDRIHQALPELNCGVCGFEKCLDFATALAEGKANSAACIPGGPKTAHTLGDILGTDAVITDPLIAAVHCKGGQNVVRTLAQYDGIADCHAALLIGNGTRACIEGCLGLGSCVRACPFGALSINDAGVAVVNRQKCTGCGTCIDHCPRGLLSMIPHVHKIYLACANHDHGERVTGYCKAGCTACGQCAAITSSGAISLEDHLPSLDYDTPGENFVAAAYSCPSKCYVDLIGSRPKANIDTKCDGCAECVAVCPVDGAITGSKGSRHVVNKSICIGCGRCLTICHVRAISLWGSLGYESKYKRH